MVISLKTVRKIVLLRQREIRKEITRAKRHILRLRKQHKALTKSVNMLKGTL